MISERVELCGDRRFGEDSAILGGIGLLGGIPVTYIALDKGHNLSERMKKNFGCAKPEGYRKALRLMKEAEKFSRPVICFVDTLGAFPGADGEQRGQGQAIAESIMEMMGLCTPVISVIIGEGGSGGALALASASKVYMLENAVYSVITPEGCASILYKDEDRLLEGAEDVDKTYIETVLPGKMRYNLRSVKNFRFFGDIKIMFMTVFAVLGKEYSDEADTNQKEKVESQ
jgi:acetyl-CoA carboxylase carboxyl transferase subunit alpha